VFEVCVNSETSEEKKGTYVGIYDTKEDFCKKISLDGVTLTSLDGLSTSDNVYIGSETSLLMYDTKKHKKIYEWDKPVSRVKVDKTDSVIYVGTVGFVYQYSTITKELLFQWTPDADIISIAITENKHIFVGGHGSKKEGKKVFQLDTVTHSKVNTWDCGDMIPELCV
jgi:hypothetical protein